MGPGLKASTTHGLLKNTIRGHYTNTSEQSQTILWVFFLPFGFHIISLRPKLVKLFTTDYSMNDIPKNQRKNTACSDLFDTSINLDQTRRPHTPRQYSMVIQPLLPKKVLFPNSSFNQSHETDLMVNMKHHISLYYFPSQCRMALNMIHSNQSLFTITNC